MYIHAMLIFSVRLGPQQTHMELKHGTSEDDFPVLLCDFWRF